MMHHIVITSAFLQLLQLLRVAVQASPIQVVATPVTTIGAFAYSGCHTEAWEGRALTGVTYYDDLMTLQKCSIACSSFTQFGVEYGREAWTSSYLWSKLTSSSVIVEVYWTTAVCRLLRQTVISSVLATNLRTVVQATGSIYTSRQLLPRHQSPLVRLLLFRFQLGDITLNL